jgi:hypothetical protein
MLFVVTHSHSAEACPLKDHEDKARDYYRSLMEDVGRKLGVTVVGAYTAPAQHMQFLVLETENLDQLTTFLKPLYKIGRVDLVPVMKASERLTELAQVAPPAKSVDYYCMSCRIDFSEDEKELHKGHKTYTQEEMEGIWPHEHAGGAGGG